MTRGRKPKTQDEDSPEEIEKIEAELQGWNVKECSCDEDPDYCPLHGGFE